MTEAELLRCRLRNQALVKSQFTSTEELVKHFGAVQAQDFFGALWSIGFRLKTPTQEPEVEKAITDKSIVRTWPMRGTLHFAPAADVRWMLHYLTPRVIARSQSLFKKDELDTKVFTKAKKVLEKRLSGNKQFTRDEMYETLESNKISTMGTRGLHILGVAAQDGLICFGPRKGKQHTFTLLDEWIPLTPMPSREEAMAILASRFLKSHGPVQAQDFAWWTGLAKGEAQKIFQSLGKDAETVSVNGKEFWMHGSASDTTPIKAQRLYMLSTYDEYGVALQDRSEIIIPDKFKMNDGRFTSTLMRNGKLIGAWRRTLTKQEVHLEIKPFSKLSSSDTALLQKEIAAYGKFLGLHPNFK